MARIAVGGMQHETNTFMPTVTDYDYFCERRDRPPLARGPEVLEWLKGSSFGLSGFMDTIDPSHELVPLVWAGGGAGGMVTDEAFERIAGEIVGSLSRQMPVDAVYLDQHGAMVTQRYQDADGELLRRVRDCVGPDVPIVASLDYHANISPEMVENADALVSYRTYPHVDRWETGERAARCIELMLERGRPAGRAFRSLAFVVPSHQQPTGIEPTKSFIAMCEAGETGDVFNLSYLGGFRLSDIYYCGVSVVASAWTHEAAEAAVDKVAAEILRREGDFAEPMYEPDVCAAKAMAIAAKASKPVLICDPQDNPGGGGSGDTTGMLAALVKANAQGTVVGTMHDAAAAAAAHEAGLGAEITIDVGGKAAIPGNVPFHGTFTVDCARRRQDEHDRPRHRWPHHRARPDGPADHRRRQRHRHDQACAGPRPGDVPAPWRRAGRTEDPRSEKRGAFPRRLRADRRDGACHQGAGRLPRGRARAALPQPEAGHAPRPEGPAGRAVD